MLEQAQNQVRVRTRNHNRGTLRTAASLHQVGAQAGTVRVLLAGNLLVAGQNSFNGAQVNLNHTRVVALLNHTGHQGALTVLELAQNGCVLSVTQTLREHLADGCGSDTAKVVRVSSNSSIFWLSSSSSGARMTNSPVVRSDDGTRALK